MRRRGIVLYGVMVADLKVDSTVGKLMEKAGHMMHKETLVEKGRAKREGAGFGVDTGKDREDFDGPTAN